MLLALEAKLDSKINTNDDVLPLLITYPAVLINRYHVGADGKTNHERLRVGAGAEIEKRHNLILRMSPLATT